MSNRDEDPQPNETAQAPESAWDARTNRREAMGLGLATGLIAPTALARKSEAAPSSPSTRRFLSAQQWATLDELTEILIPTDEHSPGARAAKVADDLDAWLASLLPQIPEQREVRNGFRRGLIEVDRLSKRMWKKRFVDCTPEQRVAVVTVMSEGDPDPKQPGQPTSQFFRDVKRATAYSYYTSEIGLHQELQYRGNTYLEDYVGYELDEPLALPAQRKHKQEKW